MTNRRNIFRPLIPLVGATCILSPFYLKLERFPSSSVPINDAPPRRLDIAVDSSDQLVTASLSVVSNSPDARIRAVDHEKITSILEDARHLMDRARTLIQEESREAKDVVDAATQKFREAKEQILRQRKITEDAAQVEKEEEKREMVETPAVDEGDLDLDLSRNVYETVSSYFVLKH